MTEKLELNLCGQRYIVRPSLEMVERIDQQFGGVFALATKFSQGLCGGTEVLDLIYLSLRGSYAPPSYEALAQDMMDRGLTTYLSAAIEILKRLLMGQSYGGENP